MCLKQNVITARGSTVRNGGMYGAARRQYKSVYGRVLVETSRK